MIDLPLKLARLGRPKVLVLGDAIIDRYHVGSCCRFAQEADGCPILTRKDQHEIDGGALAVAEMVNALGGAVELLRGPHAARRERFLAGDRQIFRLDVDAAATTASEELALVVDVHAAVEEVDCVLIADYGQGACTRAVLAAAIDGARRRSIPCIVDPARYACWDRYAGTTAIKCNAREWDWASRDPRSLLSVPLSVVTLGSEGISLERHLGDEPGERFPARPRQVLDVTAAGDMVLAALGVGIAGGLGWRDACKFANAAAGCKVAWRGAAVVCRSEAIVDLLQDSAAGKSIVPELLPAVVDSARCNRRRIVFTNGCFDVLHAGHVQLLREARAQGDLLIVGLDSDAGVRALKGPTRPVNVYQDRAAALAGLDAVDWIVPFGVDELDALVRAVRPDVLVKGGDYAGLEICGADHAGAVHIAALRPGLSTTRILEGRP